MKDIEDVKDVEDIKDVEDVKDIEDVKEHEKLYKGIAIFIKVYANALVVFFVLGLIVGEFVFDDKVVNTVYYIFLVMAILFEICVAIDTAITTPEKKFKITDILATMLATAAIARFCFQLNEDGAAWMLMVGAGVCLFISWLTKPIVFETHIK